MAAFPVFPFMPGGAADGTRLATGAVVLGDLTAHPRFGLKGGGSAAWLTAHGIALPALNRIGSWRGTRVLRLGNEDILLLAEGADNALAELATVVHRDIRIKVRVRADARALADHDIGVEPHVFADHRTRLHRDVRADHRARGNLRRRVDGCARIGAVPSAAVNR